MTSKTRSIRETAMPCSSPTIREPSVHEIPTGPWRSVVPLPRSSSSPRRFRGSARWNRTATFTPRSSLSGPRVFLVTDFCSTYCRYCTRSRLVGPPRRSCPGDMGKSLAYIEACRRSGRSFLSGGVSATRRRRARMAAHKSSPHSSCRIVLIGTKFPWCCPSASPPT